MRVLRIAWLGIPTQTYSATLSFLRDTLGLGVEFEEVASVELSLANDDRIQLFAPGHPYFDFVERQATRLVPLLEVDDVDLATSELEAAGATIVGSRDSDDTWTWIHVLAPDGTLLALASRPTAS